MLSEAKHLDIIAIRVLRFFAEFILSEAEGLRMTVRELVEYFFTFAVIIKKVAVAGFYFYTFIRRRKMIPEGARWKESFPKNWKN